MTEEVDKHVLKKFDIAQKLGKGAYGIVWKAYDRKDRSNVVALKKSIAQWTRTWYHRLPSPSCFLCPAAAVFDAFQNATDAQVRFKPSSRADPLLHCGRALGLIQQLFRAVRLLSAAHLP